MQRVFRSNFITAGRALGRMQQSSAATLKTGTYLDSCSLRNFCLQLVLDKYYFVFVVLFLNISMV